MLTFEEHCTHNSQWTVTEAVLCAGSVGGRDDRSSIRPGVAEPVSDHHQHLLVGEASRGCGR